MVNGTVDNCTVALSALSEDLRIELPRVNNSEVAACGSWNEASSEWTTAGCRLGNVTNTSVECLCTHFGLFAAFLQTPAPTQAPTAAPTPAPTPLHMTISGAPLSSVNSSFANLSENVIYATYYGTPDI